MKQHDIKTFEHYRGSLDFPCDVCYTHSYNNYHVKNEFEVLFVICKDCILKVIFEGDIMTLTTKTAQRLKEEYQIRRESPKNRGILGLTSIHIYAVISFKNELKEIIQGKSSDTRKIDRIKFLIQEIESVEQSSELPHTSKSKSFSEPSKKSKTFIEEFGSVEK